MFSVYKSSTNLMGLRRTNIKQMVRWSFFLLSKMNCRRCTFCFEDKKQLPHMMLNSALNPIARINVICDSLWYNSRQCVFRAIHTEVVCLLAYYKAWHLITTRCLTSTPQWQPLDWWMNSLPLHNPNHTCTWPVFTDDPQMQRTKHQSFHTTATLIY